MPYFVVSFSRTSAICVLVADHESEVAGGRVPRHSFALEHREELVLADFEERIAFALVELFQAEDILVKGDRLLDVADLDGDVIAAIDLNAHD